MAPWLVESCKVMVKKKRTRKVMTNLDNILKSRDITLPAKIHLVKAMVFLVVIYGCESWTIRKAECLRVDAFNYGVGEDS